MKDIIQSLQWRYATKQYDTGKKLSDEQLAKLMDAVCLAPSSFGLEPWKLLVIENEDLRAQLRDASWGQAQVTDASHFAVFCVPTVFGDADIDKFVELMVAERGIERSAVADYEGMMKGAIAAKSEAERVSWATKQAYLALGVLLTAAALEEIDATPMEGFDSAKYDEILGLKEKGLTSEVVIALGFRSDDDAYASMKKVRFPKEQMIIELK